MRVLGHNHSEVVAVGGGDAWDGGATADVADSVCATVEKDVVS